MDAPWVAGGPKALNRMEVARELAELAAVAIGLIELEEAVDPAELKELAAMADDERADKRVSVEIMTVRRFLVLQNKLNSGITGFLVLE